jgi:iron complex transport system ATP-binding protein
MRLQTQNLTIKIGKKMIYSSVNLDMQAGEVWGILGANGSGKTTLLHTLAGLYPDAYSSIFLQARDLTTYTNKMRAQQIGIAFQECQTTFPQTVEAYCMAARYPHHTYFQIANPYDQQQAQQAMQQMELQSLAQRNIMTLSGGEKKRLAIAALLTQAPQIYLLDEPTNHLDIKHQHTVLDYFSRLSSSLVIMSLHDMNHVQRYCTHALLLYPNGEIMQGSINHILTEDHLSRLYQHRIHSFVHNHQRYWTSFS